MKEKLFILGNGVDWCEKSLEKLVRYENVIMINKKIPVEGSLKKMIAKVFFSNRFNLKEKISHDFLFSDVFKSINEFSKGKKINILIFDHNKFGSDYKFISKLKSIPNVNKVIYIFTNIVKYTAANEVGYLDKLNDWYDVVFAFDPEDARKYHFSYSPLIYDADPTYKRDEMECNENLVFYVGQAKDRLPGLLSCYEKLKSLGISTDFHIANVAEEDIKYSDKIVYNRFMTYDECVNSIQKATCLIDIIQGESTGLTIKTCEAVCYNKKLITTNKHVAKYPFYDPRYIKIVNSPDDIDESFFFENRDVHYSENGRNYFSADEFLKRLGEVLDRKKD